MKKLLVTLMCVMMFVAMMPVMAFAGTVNTTENAQKALDTKGANVNITLADGNYNQLGLKAGIFDSVADGGDGSSNNPYVRTRSIEKIVVAGGVNAKVAGFDISSGFRTHYESPTYYAIQKYDIGTLKFEGITFKNQVNIVDPQDNLKIKEVIFENVTFDMGNANKVSAAHFIAGAGNFDKITFKNCNFINCKNTNYPIIIDARTADDVEITVEGCTIDAAAYNGMQISGTGSNFTGKISIIDNTISNTVDRGLRISMVGAGAKVVIKNNKFIDAADADGEFVKFDVTAGATVEFTGNTFNGVGIKEKAVESGTIIYNKDDDACRNHAWDNGVVTITPTVDNEGSKTFTCANCGITKIETIAKVEVEVAAPTVDATKPAEKVEVGVTKETAKELESVANEVVESVVKADAKTEVVVEEKVTKAIEDAVDAGKEVTVTTSIVATPVDEKDVEATFGKDNVVLVEKAAGDATVAQYLDLSVLMTVSVNGQEVATGKVAELSKEVTFTIAIPEELKTVKEGVTREYYVIRVHEGKTDKLPVTVNADGTLSFKTDRFSTYALAYEDKETPKTGDANAMMPWLAVMAVAAVGAVSFKKREN